MKKKTMKEIVGVVKAIKYIESLDENTTVISHSVNGMFHYIITERKMSESEAKEFREKQLKNQIKECNERWERRIKNCEQLIHEYNQVLNHEMANLYIQRREDLIEGYNEEQRKLANKLDKLVKLDYTEFIR